MADRVFEDHEIQDRFAIADLYDRQLAAAEAWDLDAYDTTFAADAEIDLRDFDQPVRRYPDYRDWLASLRAVMPKAQRISGGLRLQLDGDRASTRVPVACFVHFDTGDGPALTYTGLFYNDVLERTSDGWRITRRYEELAWQGQPG
jgi:hypothetical protein